MHSLSISPSVGPSSFTGTDIDIQLVNQQSNSDTINEVLMQVYI